MKITFGKGFHYGFFMTVIFATLKLTGQLDWSWWNVLTPMTLLLYIFLTVLLLEIIYYMLPGTDK